MTMSQVIYAGPSTIEWLTNADSKRKVRRKLREVEMKEDVLVVLKQALCPLK